MSLHAIRILFVSAVIGCTVGGLTPCQRLPFSVSARAQEAEWIWAPNVPKEGVPPQSVVVFRKRIDLPARPEQAQVVIGADDTYTLFVNGRQVGVGNTAKNLDVYDITAQLNRGRNVIAVRVTNLRGNTAAMAARVLVKQPGNPWVSHSSNPTWKSYPRQLPMWHVPFINDGRWPNAQSFGKLGETAPWDVEEGVASEDTHLSERFKISEEFEVRRVVHGEELGSLIAMAFNEFGQIVASQENGSLVLIHDTDQDGLPDSVRPICKQVTNCQGILPLNGVLFVTGEGPDGAALYRLEDPDRDGNFDQVHTVLKFKGQSGEHGAHAVALGPDGFLYVVVGNHTRTELEYSASSPYRGAYEGDLLPRYEDPGGHAAGIKSPGGIVIRTDSHGNHVELISGGLRNAYDLVFDRNGELFVHDSDMESDLGTTWYRPTRLLHVTAGSEFGWRSGWAKWPEYFFDSLPSIANTGRGSPTGAALYDHFMFPARYHGALFTADWSEGRILAVTLKPNGASYSADTEVFLKGSPLNVSDLEVGPDGALWFITGGRGTNGGVYRVAWRGDVPEAVSNLGQGISRAIRQPQLNSAWGRQQIAEVKDQLGADWDAQVEGVAISVANPANYRVRALDLMQLFGPVPSEALLLQLASDQSEDVRGKAVALMALYQSEKFRAQASRMLADSDRLVRRRACEALLRAGWKAPAQDVVDLLSSDDRFESWAARRLVERLPQEQWRSLVLESRNNRVLAQGALALVISDPSPENVDAVLKAFSQRMQSFISDRNFVDLLRTAQVAILRGQIKSDGAPEFRRELILEFPAGNPLINRELARLLVHFQVEEAIPLYVKYLQSDATVLEKLHLAMQIRFQKTGWTEEQQLAVLEFFAQAQKQDSGGGNYAHYVMNVTTDFARSLSPEASAQVVALGAKWPGAALGALFNLPKELDDESIAALADLDLELAGQEDEASKRLRVGLVAVLARSNSETAMKHLRDLWNREPERRSTVAMGLAQKPDGENWSYLMRSIPFVEGAPASEILQKLREVRQAPAESEYFRQTILCGLRLGAEGGIHAARLLEFWSAESPAPPDANWEASLAAWQQWFALKYPDKPPAELPVSAEDSRWDLDELVEFLESDEGRAGDSQRGQAVFQKAQCNKCHRFGGAGETLGPDLTSIAKRFSKRELLQAVLFPSHVIPDQYQSKIVETADGQRYEGLVTRSPQGALVILKVNGEKVTVDENNVERTRPSQTSAMPEGLFNNLALEEIADLFAYLGVVKPSLARQPGISR